MSAGDCKVDKQALRARMREVRQGISQEERRVYDRRIAERALEFAALKRAKSAMVYASMESEVDTWGLMEGLLSAGIAVCLPVMRPGRTLEGVRIWDFSGLVRHRFGVMQPEYQEELVVDRPEVVFVPGLAFDGQGHRLGYGAGYYDRYLKGRNACAAGLCYGVQLVERLPRDGWDVPVGALITERGTIQIPEAGMAEG